MVKIQNDFWLDVHVNGNVLNPCTSVGCFRSRNFWLALGPCASCLASCSPSIDVPLPLSVINYPVDSSYRIIMSGSLTMSGEHQHGTQTMFD